MPRIKCLPEEVSRRIAAGEVVERPASVVKELVENALDAGATSVTIDMEKGGLGRITIEDDGCGMSREDLSLAPRNFSTSKIRSAADLFEITTYGFRGEALASISAVSLMSIRTNDTEGAQGWELDLASADASLRPAPRTRGTTVTVKNLFYNTPARRKFLGSELAEKRRILETALGFALIHHDVEFHLIDGGKHLLDLIPAVEWRARVAAVLGSSSMKHMVPVESTAGSATLRGFASLPAFTRSNRTHQYFYVNGRLVKEKTMMHAVMEAYRGVIPPRRFPVLVIALKVPSQEVDVNVHPSKLEVRLRNARDVHALCTRALREVLSGGGEESLAVSRVPGAPSEQSGTRANGRDTADELLEGAIVKEEGRGDDNKVIPLKSRIERAYSLFMQRQGAARDISEQLSLRSRDEIGGMEKKGLGPEKHALDEGLFWQFNKSFIFIQVHGGLVIIDQHAAHERIIFDTSRKSLEKSISVSQQILFPIHLELSLSELDVFHSSREIFERLGFVIEPFGGKSILVRGYPQGLKNWDEGRLLIQILDDIVQDRVPGEDHAHKILASFACRSAVKAGHKLKVDEMQVLADQLFAVENPYSCPHGRPTIQRISLDEIEKWFLR